MGRDHDAGLQPPHQARWSPARLALAAVEPQRAFLELGALTATMPLLLATRGRAGGPVLVVAGLSAGSGWSVILRRYLMLLGHSVHAPTPGSTKGSHNRVRRALIRQVEALAGVHGSPVSVVGWSVGGCLGRQVALARPEAVGRLVTLGTPLTQRWFPAGQQAARGALSVPTTAIYSRSDGVFHWSSCRQPVTPTGENVEVHSSHLGMASHPQTFHIVADRLAQPPEEWRPYDGYSSLGNH